MSIATSPGLPATAHRIPPGEARLLGRFDHITSDPSPRRLEEGDAVFGLPQARRSRTPGTRRLPRASSRVENPKDPETRRELRLPTGPSPAVPCPDRPIDRAVRRGRPVFLPALPRRASGSCSSRCQSPASRRTRIVSPSQGVDLSPPVRSEPPLTLARKIRRREEVSNEYKQMMRTRNRKEDFQLLNFLM